MAVFSEGQIDGLRQAFILDRVGRVKMRKSYIKLGVVALVLGLHTRDQFLGRNTLVLCAQHNRRAMGIVGAGVDAVFALEALKAHPDIRLHGL